MTRDPVTITAYVALGVWTAATLVVGALYHFAGDGDRYQPWVSPMCMVTVAAAMLVDRISRKRRPHKGCG